MSPPMEAPVSTAPAKCPGKPLRIISGIVKLPVTAVLAAPLPLTRPTDTEARIAVWGTVWRERPASRRITFTIASWAPKPRAAAASSRKAAIRVRASCAYRP